MIISKSNVELAAQHSASSQTDFTESLRAWIGNERPDFAAMSRGTTASISAAALAALKANPPAPPAAVAAANETQALEDALNQADNDPMLQLIRLMVEILSGHKLDSLAVKALRTPAGNAAQAAPAAPPAAPLSPPRAGYGVEYDRHVVYQESEQLRLQASGTVLTADGRQIAFKLDLSMRRELRLESDTSLRLGDGVKKDPLVINYAADSVGLASQRFSFSLDGRSSDSLPMLAAGSGFLALDLNHNGLIDSGKELFGAASGNGFADLAAYDSDSNGWIDENDPVFGLLRIWTPGTSAIASLRDRNVGALALVKTASPFEIKDESNHSLGKVRASGVYLREDGSAGTLQQVDLSV